jgi:hypothetical protein
MEKREEKLNENELKPKSKRTKRKIIKTDEKLEEKGGKNEN